MANKLIMKLAKSVRRWAASVAMARLPARAPPGGDSSNSELAKNSDVYI